MFTGNAATFIVGLIVFAVFALGLKKIYKNFASGESDCCGSGGCSSCSSCKGHEAQSAYKK